MPDQLSEIKKTLEKMNGTLSEVGKGVSALGTAQKKAMRSDDARRIVDVDALTDAEVDELRELIGHTADLTAYSKGRIADGGDSVRGMYREFEKLGLLAMAGDDGAFALSPSAWWAVEKRDQLAAERTAELERQWTHDRKMTWIAAISGLVGAVIGAVLTVLLTRWLLPTG